MKKLLLSLCISALTTLTTYSQITFEKGYFIGENNERIECLIKNIDWRYNPIGFDYKLSETSEIVRADIKTTKEFGIAGAAKYIRARVKIDKSSDEIRKLSIQRGPEFNEELLFLKKIIEGNASLYLYAVGNVTRFFFNETDSTIAQLVYKRYRLPDGKFGVNDAFKQQLFNTYHCPEIVIDDVSSLDYSRRSLERFFARYNECSHSTVVAFTSKVKRDKFNLTVRPGIMISNLSLEDHAFVPEEASVDFGKKLNFRFGVEMEYILPFNKNKWSLFLEPTYHNLKNKASNAAYHFEVKYKSIEFPFGVRHYFFLQDASKVFVDVAYLLEYSYQSQIDLKRNTGYNSTLHVSTRPGFAFGAGYKFMDRYSLGIRYQTKRNILNNYVGWNSYYSSISLIVGITLF